MSQLRAGTLYKKTSQLSLLNAHVETLQKEKNVGTLTLATRRDSSWTGKGFDDFVFGFWFWQANEEKGHLQAKLQAVIFLNLSNLVDLGYPSRKCVSPSLYRSAQQGQWFISHSTPSGLSRHWLRWKYDRSICIFICTIICIILCFVSWLWACWSRYVVCVSWIWAYWSGTWAEFESQTPTETPFKIRMLFIKSLFPVYDKVLFHFHLFLSTICFCQLFVFSLLGTHWLS